MGRLHINWNDNMIGNRNEYVWYGMDMRPISSEELLHHITFVAVNFGFRLSNSNKDFNPK